MKYVILWNSGEYSIENELSKDDDTAIKIKDIKKVLLKLQVEYNTKMEKAGYENTALHNHWGAMASAIRNLEKELGL